MPAEPLSSMPQHPAGNSGLFPATMWSMIQAAKEETEALTGLERLARAYWRPLFVFARQRGASHDVAADEVQGFFEHLLSRDMLKNVQRGEVRFRSFLLRCFTNWHVNEHEREGAAKRGGGAAFVRIDDLGSQIDEPALIEGESPDTAYDQGWARALVEQAMKRLELELQQHDNRVFLLELRQRTFATRGAGPDWEELALRHGMSHGAVRKAAADLRKRFGVLLRTEVRNIVSKDEEVDDELRYLINLLSIAA
ncbi:MAG: RNA polymerase sigma factor [Prosthecobacter sp.]|uniref:RNA polymerase sigma factor n=1 Tax=Prosthecobacter sp. TaxID=1965333 RepID=UPI0039035A6D